MNRDTFDAAYEDWKKSARPKIDYISSLRDIYQDVEHHDDEIGAALTQYRYGQTPAVPRPEQWPDTMNWLLSRDIQNLRRRLQRGRHQVATRALLDHMLALKRAFDAYRAATIP